MLDSHVFFFFTDSKQSDVTTDFKCQCFSSSTITGSQSATDRTRTTRNMMEIKSTWIEKQHKKVKLAHEEWVEKQHVSLTERVIWSLQSLEITHDKLHCCKYPATTSPWCERRFPVAGNIVNKKLSSWTISTSEFVLVTVWKRMNPPLWLGSTIHLIFCI